MKRKRRMGLTIKQRKYVEGVVSGKTGKDAVMDAYNVKDSNTAAVMSSQNLEKPYIREAILTAFQEQNVTASSVVVNLKKLANHNPDNISGDTVFKANKEILKIMDAYPTQRQLKVGVETSIESKGYEEAAEELEKLNKLTKQLLSES